MAEAEVAVAAAQEAQEALAPAASRPANPARRVPPETPAVPEPGTWATMMMGFALSGCMLRRRRARARPPRNA